MGRSLSVVLAMVGVLVAGSAYGAAGENLPKQTGAVLKNVAGRYPGLQAFVSQSKVRSLYGRSMTTGRTPVEAAEQFRLNMVQVFGVEPADLQAVSLLADSRHTQPVMYDPATGRYKFTLVYYTQSRDGVPVFRSDLRLLVRHETDFPVVLAKSTLHDLGTFSVGNAARQAVRGDLGVNAAKIAIATLVDFTAPQTVIWAGTMDQEATPRLAVTFVGENRTTDQKQRFVTDASTGAILYQENLILQADVTGNVSGLATQGSGAEQCGAEAATPLPHIRVSIGANAVFADGNGDFVLPNGGTANVTVDSALRGQWFRVFNDGGTDALLSQTVAPPGPADFLHNPANTELTRAEVNGYLQANVVRDFVLQFNPAYPVIAAQTEFPVNVNQIGGICPGNAFYDGVSVNFCQAGGSNPNTAWATVVHHEYGHHLVAVAGSGQDQYGEGMGDTIGMVITDESGTGLGFFGSCSVPLREADNTKQFPCAGEIHECGRLLSGAVWSTRNELLATNPGTYRDIISGLAVNSILLHTGNTITPQIAIDFLTLDDDDADIGNGTPHRSEICAGFGAHNLTCPALILLDFQYPNGVPQLLPPAQDKVIDVNLLPQVGTPMPGTGMVHYRVGESGAFTTVAMNELSPNVYQATLPAMACGDNVEFFFSAEASGLGTFTDPLDGANAPYSAITAAELVQVSAFDFETTTGWTVSGNATDGQWNSGVPVNSNRGDPPSDFDGSGQCFLTDNVPGNSDVDGGTTTLTSPVFDLSGATDPRVRYARWYSNVEGNSPQADTLVVKVSNDAGASWVILEIVGPTGTEVAGGWFEKTFRISDFLPPTGQFQIRFDARDLGAGSVVEAGVDGFEVFDANCGFSNPLTAPLPFNTLKNRYVSFAPNNATNPVNFQVEMISGPGNPAVLGWVGVPDTNGISRIVPSPLNPARVWTEPVVHVADCGIVPVASYVVRSTPDGGAIFSADLVVNTIAIPTGGRTWGDTVGLFDSTSGQWLPPDSVVNGFDVVAILQKFSLSPDAPHISWVDLNPQIPDLLINGNDVLQGVNAFSLRPYPFVAPESCPQQ